MLYTLAGPEISVATTKAYSAQLAAMYCLAVQFARVREKITEEQYSFYISELLSIPEKMEKVLEDKERIQWFAAKYANAHDVFFVGRLLSFKRIITTITVEKLVEYASFLFLFKELCC